MKNQSDGKWTGNCLTHDTDLYHAMKQVEPQSHPSQPAGALRNRHRAEAGQALLLVTFALPVIIGMVGFATDVGLLFLSKRLAQTAADSAAIAGATALRAGAAVTATAKAAAAANKFTDGAGGVTVTINNGPLNGPHAGDRNYVEAIVIAPEPTFFLNVLGFSSQNVAARAVAFLTSNSVGFPPGCIYLVAPSGVALSLTGTANISATCGIDIDSSASNALTATGSSNINAPVAIVGNKSFTGSVTITPAAVTGIAPFGNPLAYLTPPAVGTCNNATLNITGTTTSTVTPGANCYNVSITGSAIVTFNPGEYSAITITGSATVTFNAGTYILAKGNLSLTGSGNVTGSGVMFYLGPSAGAVSATGSSRFNLVAPTTGSYAGILFYQDAGNTRGGSFTGSTTNIYQGTLYFPAATLQWTGSSSTSTAYTIIVSTSLSITGTGTLTMNSNYSSLPSGSPVKNAVLVE